MDGLQGLLAKADAQNFGPNDSNTISAINHPLTGLLKLAELLDKHVKTTAGIDGYYRPDQKVDSALTLAGLLQGGGAPVAEGGAGVLGTVKNPFSRILDSVANLEKKAGGHYQRKIEQYGVVPPYEAFDVRANTNKGLDVNDLYPSQDTIQHGLTPSKIAGVSLLQGLEQPLEGNLKNLQHFSTLKQMAQGVKPINTEFGKETSAAVNKLGGLLMPDMNIVINGPKQNASVSKVADLMRQMGWDPNDQERFLNYLKADHAHVLNHWSGTNIYRGADAQGKVIYPDLGWSGKELNQWAKEFTDGNQNFTKQNFEDILRVFQWQNDKGKGLLNTELF